MRRSEPFSSLRKKAFHPPGNSGIPSRFPPNTGEKLNLFFLSLSRYPGTGTGLPMSSFQRKDQYQAVPTFFCHDEKVAPKGSKALLFSINKEGVFDRAKGPQPFSLPFAGQKSEAALFLPWAT